MIHCILLRSSGSTTVTEPTTGITQNATLYHGDVSIRMYIPEALQTDFKCSNSTGAQHVCNSYKVTYEHYCFAAAPYILSNWCAQLHGYNH